MRRLAHLWSSTALLGLVACSVGSLPSTVVVSSTSVATTTTLTTTTQAPTTTTTTVPGLPEVDLADPLVWFAPNMGSVDFPQLFSEPELWVSAREQVDVFKFYGNNVWGFPYDIGGDNVLDTFVEVDAFQKLHEWGTAVALELGVVKFFACEPQSWVDYADLTIDNIESNGGRVSFVAMDEPLLGGQLIENGETCGYTMEQTAQVVAEYVQLIQAAHPDVMIGTIETIPPQTPDEVRDWIIALETAGVTPAFLHLDIEVAYGIEDPGFLAAIGALAEFAEERGIPVGLILTADWQVADSDQSYHRSVLQFAEAVKAGLGRPSHLVFQSWIGPAPSGLHEMPINLPDTSPDVYSHTRLILDGLQVFD